MPFSDAERLLRDIVDAIGMIESFTAGMDLEEFRDDPKTVAAVERKLQVISEVAIRLGGDARDSLPGNAMAGYSRHGQLAASPVRAD